MYYYKFIIDVQFESNQLDLQAFPSYRQLVIFPDASVVKVVLHQYVTAFVRVIFKYEL